MFHRQFYPQQQEQQSFHNGRGPTNFFMPSQPFCYRPGGPVLNQSTHNLNFTRDFERFSTPHHGFTSIPSNGYSYFDFNNPNIDQQRWRPNMTRPQQQHRRTPAFHFQDKSTFYYMTDPILTSDDRLTIQLTKVHVGPNGDQQRVFVEQDFSNENELNKFVRNLRHNFEKTFNNRSSDGSSNNEKTDESNSTDSKKPGVVVVEEPDEEPKIYQQQAYNANIESKQAAASVLTPPMSPTMESTPPPPPPSVNPTKSEDRSRSYSRKTSSERHHRTKYVSPPGSQMSSSSTARSNRRHKNKMKYRRQQTDNKMNRENVNQTNSSRIFQMPSFTRHYQPTPPPSHFQQRFFSTDNDFRMKNDFNRPPNPNFQWRHNQTVNGYAKTRSRSYVPPMKENFRPPPPSSRFQNTTDPVFRPVRAGRFPQHHHHHHHHRQKDFHPPPSPSTFRRSQRRKPNQPTTIAENLVYPNNEEQQPRVHRTKSECRNSQKQEQFRSRSTTNQFQNFSPLQQPPIIQRHFIPFRSPQFVSSAPMFYPNQRPQFGSMQVPLRLINPYRLGSNRF